MGGRGNRKGRHPPPPNAYPLTAKRWLEHWHDCFPPPLLSFIATTAILMIIDHPAKAQAVAAELKVWKSWRGMRSRDVPENQVGKQVAGQGPTVRASQPCLSTQTQVTNGMVLLLLVCMHLVHLLSGEQEKEVFTFQPDAVS